jgi:signal transduction histidine kinase
VTLTNRLSLVFLAALAAVLAGFSATLYLLADHHLHRRLDDRLDAAVRAVAAAAEAEPDGVEWEGDKRPPAFGPGGGEVRWAVAADDGRVIDHSPQPGTVELLAAADPAIRAARRLPKTFEHGEDEWRATRVWVMTPAPPALPAHGKHSILVITVAVPRGPTRATLHALAAALAGLAAAVLLVALVLGRWVCRRALAPVTRMADAARGMGAGDRTARLPVGSSADELADLGAAFNDLLDRVHTAAERERRFAAEAAHQLRTPLAGIIGQAEVALRRDRDPDEYRQALGAVLAEAGRLRRVTEALLFLARSEADAGLPGVEPTDLAAWVPGRLRRWADHPRAADLRFEPPAVPAVAAVHPDLFGELLDALVDNALKYSPAGTPVTVRVGRENGAAWVEVEDRGCGIAPDDLPHLFRPFTRSDTARRLGVPGAGLGLAVAARVAAAHGGRVEAAGEPGPGARFRASVPGA